MLKKYLTLLNDIKVALFKVALMSSFMCFSFLLFGKDYNGDDIKTDEKTIIFVLDDTKLYLDNEGVLYNAEIVEENHTKKK